MINRGAGRNGPEVLIEGLCLTLGRGESTVVVRLYNFDVPELE